MQILKSIKSPRFLRRLGFLIIALIGISFGLSYAYDSWERNFYLKALPEKIETSSAILIESSSGLLDGCGVAMYVLSDTTQKNIQQLGPSFLEDARQGRGYPNNSYYSYTGWHETPVPSSWFESNELAGFACVRNRERLYREIADTLTSRGSYFTTKDGATLIVNPARRLAVFVHFG